MLCSPAKAAFRNADVLLQPIGNTMQNVLSVGLIIAASLISLNPVAATEVTAKATPTVSAPVPDLVSMHVPKKYSRSEAIAKAQAKYPGYTLSKVRELQNVWVVILKK